MLAASTALFMAATTTGTPARHGAAEGLVEQVVDMGLAVAVGANSAQTGVGHFDVAETIPLVRGIVRHEVQAADDPGAEVERSPIRVWPASP